MLSININDIKEPITMFNDNNDHGVDMDAPSYLNPCVGYFVHNNIKYNIYAFQYQPNYEEKDPLYFRNNHLKRIYLKH